MAAPAGYSSLGLVGFTDMGNYNAQLSYMKNDLTHSSGKLWRSKVDDNVGHTPEEGAYWTLWIDAPENLSELQDVYIYNPANGDILSYNATLGQWTKSDALGKEVNIRARLGAHNINKSEQTFTINNTTSPKRFYVGGVSDLKQSEQLTISFDVSAVSGYSGSNALRVDMVADSLVSPMDDCGISVTHYEKSISVFNDVELTDTNVYFELRIPAGESSSATVTISNLLIKFANDASSEVTPFAEDNEVLTGKIASVGSEVNSIKTALANNVNANGSKNILPNDLYSQTKNNISVAVNDDGIITLNNTANAFTDLIIKRPYYIENGTYIFSKGLSAGIASINFLIAGWNGSSWVAVAQNNGLDNEFTIDGSYEYYTVQIQIQNGVSFSNTVIKPMISFKSDYDLDPTYVPPAKTNRQLTHDSVTWEDESQIGAVNWLAYPYYQSTNVSGGITYTDNGDGSITVNSGTVSASGPSIFLIADGAGTAAKHIQKLRGKTVKIVLDCDKSLNSNNHNMQVSIRDSNNVTLVSATLNYTGKRESIIVYVPNNADNVYWQLWNRKGSTISEAYTVKPMITPVNYNGGYVPYAKSNGELTSALTLNSDSISVNTSYLSTPARNVCKKVGGVKFFDLQADIAATITAGTTVQIGTLPSGYYPTYNNGYVEETVVNSVGVRVLLEITSDGKIKITPRSTDLTTTVVLMKTFM